MILPRRGLLEPHEPPPEGASCASSRRPSSNLAPAERLSSNKPDSKVADSFRACSRSEISANEVGVLVQALVGLGDRLVEWAGALSIAHHHAMIEIVLDCTRPVSHISLCIESLCIRLESVGITHGLDRDFTTMHPTCHKAPTAGSTTLSRTDLPQGLSNPEEDLVRRNAKNLAKAKPLLSTSPKPSLSSSSRHALFADPGLEHFFENSNGVDHGDMQQRRENNFVLDAAPSSGLWRKRPAHESKELNVTSSPTSRNYSEAGKSPRVLSPFSSAMLLGNQPPEASDLMSQVGPSLLSRNEEPLTMLPPMRLPGSPDMLGSFASLQDGPPAFAETDEVTEDYRKDVHRMVNLFLERDQFLRGVIKDMSQDAASPQRHDFTSGTNNRVDIVSDATLRFGDPPFNSMSPRIVTPARILSMDSSSSPHIVTPARVLSMDIAGDFAANASMLPSSSMHVQSPGSHRLPAPVRVPFTSSCGLGPTSVCLCRRSTCHLCFPPASATCVEGQPAIAVPLLGKFSDDFYVSSTAEASPVFLNHASRDAPVLPDTYNLLFNQSVMH